MKHVQACLSASEDQESSFHHCGSPLSLVQTCSSAGNPDEAVLTSEAVQRSTCRHV